MKLISKYFKLDELIHTSTGLINVPDKEQFDNLQKLVTNVLDPLRELYGHPITVNSAFRSKAVNKLVKGATNSDHCYGYAADLDCNNNLLLFNLIRNNFIFRQLIMEGGTEKNPAWIHVAYNENDNKKQVLRMSNGTYTKL